MYLADIWMRKKIPTYFTVFQLKEIMKNCWSEMHQFENNDPITLYAFLENFIPNIG